MSLGSQHGRFSTFRNAIALGARRSFSDYMSGKVRPATVEWHWQIKEAPCIGVFQQDPFYQGDEPAAACFVVVRMDLVFVAGAPGADHVSALADHWSDWAVGGRPLKPVVDDELWNPADMPPVIETVGGFREYDFGHGQPLVASIAPIRAEMHLEQ